MISRPSLRNALRVSIADSALCCILAAAPSFALAQDSANDRANYAWQAGAIRYAQQMRAYLDADRGEQPTPPVIPEFDIGFDPSGLIATFQPGGPTVTSQNPFFANLGTNGRTCFSCHQPQTGWGVSAASVQGRFYASYGNDPIFRLIDGATCPTDDVSSIEAKHQAYSLLLGKGLIRIGLSVPVTAEYRIVSVTDPYGCNTNPVTGLTNFGPSGPTTGTVSIYRRPLPSINLGFLTTIMWDGREPTLAQQSIDATLIHAQANAGPRNSSRSSVLNLISSLRRFSTTRRILAVEGNRGLVQAGLAGDGCVCHGAIVPLGLVGLIWGFLDGIAHPSTLDKRDTGRDT